MVKPLKEGASRHNSYLIIGCGYFGSRAAKELFLKNSNSKIVVVDKSKKAFQKVSRLPVQTVACDGILYLNQFLSEDRKVDPFDGVKPRLSRWGKEAPLRVNPEPLGMSLSTGSWPRVRSRGSGRRQAQAFRPGSRRVDYIIPALPLHLAFEFILSQLKPLGVKRKRIPDIPGLPNPVIGQTGDLYTSFANFLCSEDCPEPAQYCTATQKRRPKPLYRILSELVGPFESRVIRSQQLGLGIGGFRPEVLSDLLGEIKKKRNSNRLILISTASRCHAVTSGLSF